VSSGFALWRRSKALHGFTAVFAATIEANDSVSTNTNWRQNTSIFVVATLPPLSIAEIGLRIHGSRLVAGTIGRAARAKAYFGTVITGLASRRRITDT